MLCVSVDPEFAETTNSKDPILKDFPMTAVRALLHSHPEHISQADAISRCIDACFACVETCTACADACLAEKHIDKLTTCIAFCRACAVECGRHAAMHQHCAVCAEACNKCATACADLLTSMRMPA